MGGLLTVSVMSLMEVSHTWSRRCPEDLVSRRTSESHLFTGVCLSVPELSPRGDPDSDASSSSFSPVKKDNALGFDSRRLNPGHLPRSVQVSSFLIRDILSDCEGSQVESDGALAGSEGSLADSEGALAGSEGSLADSEGSLVDSEVDCGSCPFGPDPERSERREPLMASRCRGRLCGLLSLIL